MFSSTIRNKAIRLTLITHIVYPIEIIVRTRWQERIIKGIKIRKIKIKLPILPASMNLHKQINEHWKNTQSMQNTQKFYKNLTEIRNEK